ncbi:S8 family serine peptidase [Microbulbifer mangrovi]|uniref:S8 family serine peptidase n=1 Tax=Microbulbifer mangrovi TaxID=927787 RepID=UPI0009906323|nr:S8 family serine peptidase [Microbulbifer mangrovi]
MKGRNIFLNLILGALCASQAFAAKKDNFLQLEENGTKKYLVVMEEETRSNGVINSQYAGLNRSERATQVAHENGLKLNRVYNKVVDGFVVEGDIETLKKLSNKPGVKYIEQVGKTWLDGTQSSAPWNLDRIDQRGSSLNGTYNYDRTGAGVTVYVLDSGIQNSHSQFEGRATSGWDFINNNKGTGTDCNGHGTHVAGTIGGKTYGVAKSVNLVSVRTQSCSGSGDWSDFIAALDWVVSNGTKPAIIHASIGGGASNSVDNAIRSAINAGFTVVVSAGNDAKDACTQSPARVKEALTVGATDKNDARASFSNYGQCVDVWAPGVDVRSAYPSSNTATASWQGTSMAAPHVSGIAALYLQGAPNAAVASVVNNVMGKVTYGKVNDRKTIDTPNLFAYSRGTSNTYTAFHRYNNDKIGNHFYTKNWWELQSAPDSSWKYEGVIGYAYRGQQSNTKPLYRYYHSSQTDHLYTANYGELGGGGNGWSYNGVAAYLPLSGNTKSLYRYYSSKIQDHFYTTNWNELEGGNSNWKYEGNIGKLFAGPQD